MTMTKNLRITCYFCETAAAVGVKQDVTPAVEEGETDTVALLPVCDDCHAHWYDGTEDYPKLLALTVVVG